MIKEILRSAGQKLWDATYLLDKTRKLSLTDLKQFAIKAVAQQFSVGKPLSNRVAELVSSAYTSLQGLARAAPEETWMKEWKKKGFTQSEARAYQGAGFSLEQAEVLKDNSFNLGELEFWLTLDVKSGFVQDHIVLLVQNGISLEDANVWLSYPSLTPELMVAFHNAGWEADDVDSIVTYYEEDVDNTKILQGLEKVSNDTDWEGVPNLSCNDILRFDVYGIDKEQYQAWLAKGVSNPSTIIRAVRNDITPSDLRLLPFGDTDVLFKDNPDLLERKKKIQELRLVSPPKYEPLVL